jgi:hypothetical protein
MYFILGGCLDGRAGIAWCTLQAFYEYLILLKAWEMKNMPTPSLDMGISHGEDHKAQAHNTVS